MLADMRGQFARMLADAGLVDRAAAATSPGGGGGGADGWDDTGAPWNRHAGRAAVVSVPLCPFVSLCVDMHWLCVSIAISKGPNVHILQRAAFPRRDL